MNEPSPRRAREALEYGHKDAFTEEELLVYNEYWDLVRVDKAAIEELKTKNKKLLEEKEQAKKNENEAKARASQH